MGKSTDSDLRFREPPPGFVVLRESDLDPDRGRHDRWMCRGIVDRRSIIRSGLRSESSACRAAWFVYDDACEIGLAAKVDNVVDADIAVAEALARKHAIYRERVADGPRLRETYTVQLDSWDHMEAALLAQIVADAGSIRRASKVLGVPRSTLAAWVRGHKDDGAWPR